MELVETINIQLAEIEKRHQTIQIFIQKTKDKIDFLKKQPVDKVMEIVQLFASHLGQIRGELTDFGGLLNQVLSDQMGDQILAQQLSDATSHYALQAEQLAISLDAILVLKRSQASPHKNLTASQVQPQTPSELIKDAMPELSGTSLNHQQQLYMFIQKLKEIEGIQSSKIDGVTAAQQQHLFQLQQREVEREQRILDLEQELYEARNQMELLISEMELRANQLADQRIRKAETECEALKAALIEEQKFNQEQATEIEVIQKELLGEVERLMRENEQLKKQQKK